MRISHCGAVLTGEVSRIGFYGLSHTAFRSFANKAIRKGHRKVKELEVGKMPQTDEEAMEYLPDEDSLLKSIVRGLYESRRGQGDTIVQALTFVFERIVEKDS